MKYEPCYSCGLGNKLLGVISSIAYGLSYSISVKIYNWESLWWYFDFPLKNDIKNYTFYVKFKGHFYAIQKVIEKKSTRYFLMKNGVIKDYKNRSVRSMINALAYRISSSFLIIKDKIKYLTNTELKKDIDIGIHIRTGKADGREFLLHYLKYKDTQLMLRYLKEIQRNGSVYISSDSIAIKNKYLKVINKLHYSNSSVCNSGFGLMEENNRCAIEALLDYYMLSRCRFLILTKCSSFSLVSLFANKIGFQQNRMYKFFGNCNLHSDLFN